jgi:hypothetical protein
MAEHFGRWSPERPHTLVVACSDGRLQEATDAFLHGPLGLVQFDRFYMPGGGGALAASGRDFIRAEHLRRECQYLVELHDVRRVLLLFHGPAENGPVEATCADYRRKMSWAKPADIRAQQLTDAAELVQNRLMWAGNATVSVYHCEVDAKHEVEFHHIAGADHL